MNSSSDESYMRVALEHARQAATHGDVPIGALVVAEGRIVGAAGNERELRADPTAHAEILALQQAAEDRGSWRLEDAAMYVTLEPCAMCAGALVLARIARLVYGPQDPKAGAAYSLYNIPQDPRLNHQVEITTGVLEEECASVLELFFKDRRR
ncbi:MAG: tRNA adenosine(34) deaminase TadA [Actinomycetota bacterium]